VLPMGPAADEERGQTPDLVSEESAPNRFARTPWVKIRSFETAAK